MEKSQRKSSIEIIKIFAMLLICFSHVVNPIVYNPAYKTFSTEFYNILYTLVKNFGWIGDYIFIACSAYFLVGNKKLNIRKIILYYLDIAILFICYYVVFLIFGVEGTKDYTFATLTTQLVFNYWYIVAYIIYLAVLPLINYLIEKMSKTLLLIVSWSSIPVGSIMLALYQMGYNVSYYVFFIFVYMTFIMAYGKKYGYYLCFKEGNKKGAVIGLIIAIVYWIGKNVLCNYIAVKNGIFIEKSLYICEKICPVYYFMGIPFLLLFKDAKIKQSKIINYISSLSLIFYIAHHNKFTALVMESSLKELYLNSSGIVVFLIFLGFGILRSLFGVVVSLIYKETIHRILVKLTSIKIRKKDIKV